MSMALKYGLMKKARMAEGGMAEKCEHGEADCPMCHADKPAEIAGGYAEGGEVDDDLVGRVMKKRKGEPEADAESADFDVLDQMDPGTDADYTGANSGDELGNSELDENDHDLISRIMRSRAKRDRMPRPA